MDEWTGICLSQLESLLLRRFDTRCYIKNEYEFQVSSIQDDMSDSMYIRQHQLHTSRRQRHTVHSTRFSDGAGQDIRSTVIRFPRLQPPVSTHVSQTLHARDLLQLEYICMRMRAYVRRRCLCHIESLSYIVLYACCCPQSRTSSPSFLLLLF